MAVARQPGSSAAGLQRRGMMEDASQPGHSNCLFFSALLLGQVRCQLCTKCILSVNGLERAGENQGCVGACRTFLSLRR